MAVTLGQRRSGDEGGNVRAVIVQEFLSLDGVMQSPGEASEFPRGGWQKQFVGEDHLRIMNQQMHEADALLLGRKTYQAFAAVWPTVSELGVLGSLAKRMNEMEKFVVSRTINKVEWNAALVRGDVAEAVGELREQPGNGLLVVGSRDLVRYLQRRNLVDEYRLWIHPVIVGSGSHLFDAGLDTATWAMKDVVVTNEGVAILTYVRPSGR
jgi:dihydrofolate reductase